MHRAPAGRAGAATHREPEPHRGAASPHRRPEGPPTRYPGCPRGSRLGADDLARRRAAPHHRVFQRAHGGVSTGLLVSGAAGFIGSHVTEALLARGDEVVGVDNFDAFYPRAVKERNLDGLRRTKGFRFVEADIVRDPLPLEGVSVVLHLAARPGVRPSLEDPASYGDTNVTGTVRVFEAARRAGRLADLALRREQARRGADGARVRASLRHADRLPQVLHGVRAPPAARPRDPSVHPPHRWWTADPDARGRVERARLYLYYGLRGRHPCRRGMDRPAAAGGAGRADQHRRRGARAARPLDRADRADAGA